ncbi:MAG: YggS family pyridoxal phosphate-dependent enzyme [Holophagaceae bacterium]|nr:YggS family pyridoxal phosphate-dependent enzyme [Holophagaceae bacterium]
MTGFAERLKTIRTRICRAAKNCGRDPNSISLLAVSKFHPVELLQEAMECGVTHFAENYVQEAIVKSEALPGATFALSGPLQRNKAKPALQHFTELMTVDRPELASRLLRIAEELDICRDIWIQVDLWEQASKVGGCSSKGIQPILDVFENSPRLPLKGFMAIPPFGLTMAFGDLAVFRNEWQQRIGQRILLSMGMSDDLEVAIRAGTDQVRVGTGLFGER